MPSLEGLVGQTIVIRSEVLDVNLPAIVKLLAVENAGVWVESPKATEHYLSEFKRQTSPKTPVWFVPFAQIAWIMSSEDYPALSEKGFGV
jgi:hypothetical protein